MQAKSNQNEKARGAFLMLGSQYYSLARYCANQVYLPVCVTLFHHAIEMLLKGYLSKNKNLKELRNIGHNLNDLWSLFKIVSQDNSLNKFDDFIDKLNQVEDLRYPDLIVEKGYILSIRLGHPTSLSLPGTEDLPQYNIDISALDDVVIAIFTLGNIPVTPYFKSTPFELQSSLPGPLRPK